MVPRIHGTGTSFRGLWRYLAHDKGADTSDRVVFAETRNLATSNPDVASRVMAATAMDAERLKANAGIRKTGRRSSQSVLHISLSWHESEADELTRDEMLRAANGAIRAIGAEDRQIVIFQHGDEPQPHVHLMINRVSPHDGRMLSSSKQKLRLSEFALSYEEERGQILCENRKLNWDARNRGEYTRGQRAEPRNIFELAANNDNGGPEFDAIKKQQRKKDAGIAAKQRAMRQRQAKEMQQLLNRREQDIRSIRSQAKRYVEAAKNQVRVDFQPKWRTLFHEQQADKVLFNQRENKMLGRIRNALRTIDFKAIVSAGDRRKAISEGFQAFGNAGARLEAFKLQQEAESKRLSNRQKRFENEAATPVHVERDRMLQLQRDRFLKERQSLITKHRLEQAGIRTDWKTRNEQRVNAFNVCRRRDDARQVTQIPSGRQTITPSEMMDQSINQFESLMNKRRAKKTQSRYRGNRDR